MSNKIQYIMDYFDEILPNAECELVYNNDIQLLIAVVLSAQTTDRAVNKVTKNLFEKYPLIENLMKLNIEQVQSFIKTLGLYKTKSKNIFSLIRIIYNDYGGVVPSNYENLVKLPGVGRKTANVMLAEYFKIPTIAVDTHVLRISKRLKLAYENDSVLIVEKKLMKKFPKDKWIKLHHQFIHFGRYICKAQNPICRECRLKDYCKYFFSNKKSIED
ncbi:MAG: endonuclease III [Bacilli bacterium]